MAALSIGAFRDPIPSPPTHPLIAFEHLSTVQFSNSAHFMV